MSAQAVNEASLAFKKALIERVMGAELGYHLGYPAGAKPQDADKQRNGKSAKTVLTDEGPCASKCRVTATAVSSRS